MADFEIAVKKTLDLEGGYVNNPNDYGGETKFGITKRWYPDVDIPNLTIEGAKEIYKKDFWDRLKLDYVKSQAIADEMFDTAVNMSWFDAAKILQKSLNLLRKDQLKVDGLIGPMTLAVMNSYKPSTALLIALNGYQFMNYEEQASENPVQKNFIKGWLLNRVGLGGEQ